MLELSKIKSLRWYYEIIYEIHTLLQISNIAIIKHLYVIYLITII